MKPEDDSEDPVDKLGIRIRARINELSPSLATVIEFIDANRLDAMTKSAVELGRMIGTSDASVIRAVKALGFDGFKELKQELAASLGKGNSAADTSSGPSLTLATHTTLRSILCWTITTLHSRRYVLRKRARNYRRRSSCSPRPAASASLGLGRPPISRDTLRFR